MFGAQYFGQEDFGGVVVLEEEPTSSTVTVGPPVSNWIVSGALGTFYCGQIPIAGAQYLTIRRRTGGGGWTHRGAVVLPKRRPTSLPSLPKLPKPPYLY